MVRAMALLGLAGCAPAEEPDPSWLEELQVVGVVLEPPSLGRVSSVQVDVTAADPRARGAEVLVWSCTDFGIGCFEQTDPTGKPRPVSQWARTTTLVGDAATVSLPVPVFPESLLEEPDTVDLVGLVWALACAPGVCDLIRSVQEEPEPGTEAWDDVARQLGHPDEWMVGLQTGWASLAVKAVPVGSDNVNPAIVTDVEALVAAPGESASLQVEFQDDGDVGHANVAAWSTLGPVGVTQGPRGATITWEAPVDVVGSGRLYVVVSDGRGGQAVYAGDVTVDR